MSNCKECNRKHGKGDKCFPPAVIQINNEPEIVAFRKVVIPASMGDETKVPVEIGKYRNVLLTYEVNNQSYLYSSDGIPTKLTVDAGDIEFDKIQGRPKYAGVEMTSQTDIPDNTGDITGLRNDLAAETTARTQADTALQADIDAEKTTREQADTTLQGGIDNVNTAIDKVVMTDLSLDTNASTTIVQLDAAKENIKTGATSTKNIPLPVASSTQAGVMNSATFDALTKNTEDIEALMEGAVAVSGLPANPTQTEVTDAWKTETGLTTPMNHANVYDVDNNKVWTYYENTTTWYATTNTTQVTVAQATNTSLGIVKGSTAEGQTFAENDGSLSVNGWDTVKANIATNTSNISSLQTAVADKQDTLGAGDITTNLIADNAVTSDKMDWTTIPKISSIAQSITISVSDVPVTVQKSGWLCGYVRNTDHTTDAQVQVYVNNIAVGGFLHIPPTTTYWGQYIGAIPVRKGDVIKGTCINGTFVGGIYA